MEWLVLVALMIGLAGLFLRRRDKADDHSMGDLTADAGAEAETSSEGSEPEPAPDDTGSTSSSGRPVAGHPPAGPRPPQDRGGGPRGVRTISKIPTHGNRVSRVHLYSAFHCQWIDGVWCIGLSVSLEGQEGLAHAVVTQRGRQLNYNRMHDLWMLDSLDAVNISIDRADALIVDPRYSQEPVVIFRLIQPRNEGRIVRSLGQGVFGFMVPESWQLESDNHVPIERERSAYHGHIVQFIEVGEAYDSRVVFRAPDGDRKVFRARQPAWELEGTAAPDGSLRTGPLYIATLPRLRRTQPDSPVVRAVIGQEGPAPSLGSRWRTVVDLNDPADAIATALKGAPPEVREAGWFYVRLYDDDDRLVESCDFRYAEGIRDVKFEHEPWVHGEDLAPSVLTVRLSEGWQLNVLDQSMVSWVRRHASDDAVRLEIDPELSHASNLPLEIRSPHGASIQWNVPISRLAWTIVREPDGPEAWARIPVLLRKDDYKPTSQSRLKVRALGYGERVARLTLLLEDEVVGEYRPRDNVFTIPLNHLFDAIEAKRVPTLHIKARLIPVGRQITVATVRRRFRCPHCPYVEPDSEQAVRHILEHHVGQHFAPLTYGEIARRHPRFPSKIYRCAYCGFYVPADDRLVNPSSTIAEHQEKRCSHARAAAAQHGGAVKVQFKVVYDPDEARRHVEQTLPQEFRCRLCREVLTFPYDSDSLPGLRRHLAAHQDILVHQVTMEDAIDG